MEYFGEGLYLIFLILVSWFIYPIKGRNHSLLLEDNGHVHHHVHKVMHAAPQGGSWSQHQQWMTEAT